MVKKIQRIDLRPQPQYDLIKYRLLEIALYDWLHRTIGIDKYRLNRIAWLLKANEMEEEDIEKICSRLLLLEPNQYEYVILYNQLQNVPQKEAFKFLRPQSMNPLNDGYKNLWFYQPSLTQDLYKEIQRVLINIKNIPFDYKALGLIQI